MRIILLIPIVLLLVEPCFGQKDTLRRGRHPYLGLTIGFANMKVKDDLVMPVRYGGTNLEFALNYLKKKQRSIQEVNIETVIGRLKTKEANINNNRARYKEP